MGTSRWDGTVGRVVTILFGVLAPIACVAFEYAWGTWGETFFDPIPTPVHAAAVLLVPLVIALLFVASVRDKEPGPFVRGPLFGAAFAVGLWYALFFLPFTPLSLFAIMMFGAGLLPLAPLTSFAILMRLRPARGTRRGAVWGGVAALGLLCVADLPQAAAQVLLSRAASPNPEAAAAALGTLRKYVPDAGIHAAAERPVSMMSPLGAATRAIWKRDRVGTSVAAWRATGEFVEPRWRGLFGWDGWDDQIAEQGGDVVGTAVADLCLASSHLSGDVDARAGLADLRWEMSFRNDAPESWDQAEARALVQLPPGAAVSDASLWVSGVERPAVFTTRSKAREAYENVVVVERRDPLLVTTSGPEQVLVQCFPVPPQGGTIRIALRFAVPVTRDSGPARIDLPRFVERNFALCDGTTHTQEIRGLGEPRSDVMAMADAGLDSGAALEHSDFAAQNTTWAADPFDESRVLVASYDASAPIPPRAIVVAVDATSSTRQARDAVAAALDAIPDGTPTSVVAASDLVVSATQRFVSLDAAERATALAALDELPWRGGVDAAPALALATARARAEDGARLLWLHGRQELLDPGDRLEALEDPSRVGRMPRLDGCDAHVVRIGEGTNRLLAALRRDGALTEPRTIGASPAERVSTLVRGWFDATPQPILRIDASLGAAPPPGPACTVPRALAALWAAGEVERRRVISAEMASQLGAIYRVVTPVTGAVVLETDADYKRAGLEDDPAPSVPEPAEWAIIAMVVLALLVAWWRRPRGAAA